MDLSMLGLKLIRVSKGSPGVPLYCSNIDMCWNFYIPPTGLAEEVVVIAMDLDLAADADRVEIYDGK